MSDEYLTEELDMEYKGSSHAPNFEQPRLYFPLE